MNILTFLCYPPRKEHTSPRGTLGWADRLRGKTEVLYSSYVKKARTSLEKSYDVDYPVPPKRNVVLVQGIEGAHRAHYCRYYRVITQMVS